MRKFGLIGYPLSHTFSPSYFTEKFKREAIADAEYHAYSIQDAEMFLGLITEDHVGFNVTIPHKEAVIPLLTRLSDEAAKIGAVNTILVQGDELIGYNSDVYGFRQSLERWAGSALAERALILGSGGASKAVQYVLSQLNIDYQIVSRKDDYLQYSKLTPDIMDSHRLIINTTPLGMSPKDDTCPAIPYGSLSSSHQLYDLVYNPEKTLFLQRGEAAGAMIKNGHDMLILQAEKSWSIWNGNEAEY